MRIRGSGSGSGSFGNSGNPSDQFRKTHHLKQKVRGVLLKREKNNMAWVEIDGTRLLALLEISHPEGSRLTFVIEQLTPSIILKELQSHTSQGESTLNAVKDFDSARILFESRFIPLARTLPTPTLDVEAFFAILGTTPQLLTYYTDTVKCAENLSAVLQDGGKFIYQPWLAPESRRQVTFYTCAPASGLVSAIIEFDHPDLGMIRTEFLHKDKRVACKIHVQNMDRANALSQFLSSRKHPELHLHASPPTLVKLSKQKHGGIIAEQLFKQ